jgi:hypothetical protein
MAGPGKATTETRVMNVTVALVAAVAALLTGSGAYAASKAFSTDGEATVYVNGDFRKEFTLEYEVQLRPIATNGGWSVLAVTILGGAPPSNGVTIGIYPSRKGVHVFTSVTRGKSNVFRDAGIECKPRCKIRLSGNAAGFVASVGTRTIATWPRFALRMPAPMVQLNGEVSRPGDALDAFLVPVHAAAGGRALSSPSCAFVTQGINVSRVAGGGLRYTGTYRNDGPATYVSLNDGRTGDTCAQVVSARGSRAQ